MEDFAMLVLKGSAAFAPPNIGGVSEGRGGFAALSIPQAAHRVTQASLLVESTPSIPARGKQPKHPGL
jgi:hypothetical protein